MHFDSIKTLLLDCDGLLVDSEPWQFEARRRAAQHFGRVLSEAEFLYHWFEGNGGAITYCAQYKLPFEQFQQLKHGFYDHFIAEKLELRPGVARFLAQVKGKYRVGLCSNSELSDLEKILDKFGLRNTFEVIISANDIEHGKPDPDGYLKAAMRLESKPAASVVFENSHIGLAAAKAAGMSCVMVPDGFGQKYHFGAADLVLERIDEVLGWM